MTSLQHYFVRAHFRYERDRFAPDLERFASWLRQHGYRGKTARGHLFRVRCVLHKLAAPVGSRHRYDTLVSAFRRCGRAAPTRFRNTRTAYLEHLRSTDRLDAAPAVQERLSEVRRAFRERLTNVLGLRPGTIARYDLWISDFLDRMLRAHQPLSALNATMLNDYLTVRSRQLASVTLSNAIHCNRAFLRFCYERGHLSARADIIDLPRRVRADRPPRAISWPLVQQFLRSIKRSDPAGRRDHAVLHLMAHYGLRANEIGSLTLDSINWQANTLTIDQAKTYSTLVLPMHPTTRRVLQEYLAVARPATALPWVFIRACAPHGPMSKFALSLVFKTRARRSGLPITQYCAYSLRHSFAMQLFRRRVGLKLIGDLMGHRSLVSTSIYLRLQTDVLRDVALPVPQSAQRAGGAI